MLRFLIKILSLSIFIKIIFFIFFLKNNPCILDFDSSQYNKIALQIIDNKGISDGTGNPEFYRVPGYPIFLAICYKIFGTNPNFIILLQILLGALISLLIFFLALTLYPGQIDVAKLAAFISCFDLGYTIFPGLILSEIIFVIFFTIFLILFLRNLNQGHKFFWAGLFLGLACLTRQVAPAMLTVSIFLLFFTPKKIKSCLSFILGFLLATGWWLARNYVLTGYIFFGTLSGPHFLNHSAVRLEMIQKNISHDQAKFNVLQNFNALVTQKQIDLGRPLYEIERCLLAEKLTVKYSLIKPVITIKHWIANILKTLFGLYSSELLFVDSGGQLPQYENNRGIKSILKRFLCPSVSNKFIIPVIYFEILLFLFLLIGFLSFCLSSLFNFDKFCVAFKALSFIGVTLFITLACGYARLRLPIECFLIILASKAWFDILKG